MVKLLLENKVDVNQQNKLGYAALHIATLNSDEEMIDFLLENNDNLDLMIKDKTGAIANHLAVRNSDKEIQKTLTYYAVEKNNS